MTLVMQEGFDNVSTIALLGAKGWTSVTSSGGGGAGINSLIAGRISGQAIRVASTSGGPASAGSMTVSLPSAASAFVVGFAFRKSGNVASAATVARLRASTTNTFNIALDTGGHLLIQNSSGTTIATGTTALNNNVWYYIEAKVVINGASGSVTVHLNGSSEIATTTGNFGSTGADSLQFLATLDILNFDYDDLYVLTTGVAPNNDFLGDVTVETIYPTADGAHTDWTPDTGTAHFSRVNEHSGTFPDDDTSFVQASTVGNRDSYTFNSLSVLSASVFAVRTNLYARKDDAGTRKIAAVVRRAGVDYDGADASLSTGYSFFTEIRETDPSTSAAWTVGGVNNAEFGVKVTA